MMKRLFLSACCLGVSALSAYNHPCPDHWQISGDFVYLLPTVDDTYFVINASASAANPTGTRQNNDFGFAPGFRVGAEYSFCEPDRELQAFFTYLNTNEKRTVSGNFLWATLGRADLASSFENYTGTAASSNHLLYERLDANYTQNVLDSHGFYLFLTPGLEYAYLKLRENTTYFITASSLTGEVHEKSRAWGIGPQMGFEVGYDFYEKSNPPSASKNSRHKKSGEDCDTRCATSPTTHTLSVTAAFSGSLLASNSKSSQTDTITTGGTLLDMTDESTWRVIPAFHARAGLNYSAHFCKVGLALGIGYEFNSYIRAVTRTLFPDDVADSLCSSEYYNFDVQGLYVSAAFSF